MITRLAYRRSYVKLTAAAIAQRDFLARGLAVTAHDPEHAGGVTAAAGVRKRLQRFHQARNFIGGSNGGPGFELSHACILERMGVWREPGFALMPASSHLLHFTTEKELSHRQRRCPVFVREP